MLKRLDYASLHLFIFISLLIQLLIILPFIGGMFAMAGGASFKTIGCYLLYVALLGLVLRHLLHLPLSLISKKIVPVVEALIVTLTILDCMLFLHQGLHIYDRLVLITVMDVEVFRKVININVYAWIFVAVATVGLISLYYLLFKMAKKRSHYSTQLRKYFIIGYAMVAMLFASIFIPFIKQRSEKETVFPLLFLLRSRPSNEPLHVNYHAGASDIKLDRKPHVVFILAESLRDQEMRKGDMPNLAKWAKDKQCIFPKYGMATGHTTAYAVFGLMYGLWGYHYQNFIDQSVEPFGLRVLKDNGYKTIGAPSAATRLSQYYKLGNAFQYFDEYKEFVSKESSIDSDYALLDWIKKIKFDQPTFLWSFFFSTHANYAYPPEFEKYLPVVPYDYNQIAELKDKEGLRTKLSNRYKNSALFIDHLVHSYLKTFPDSFWDNAILVFSGDHGQSLGEDGTFGHGQTTYINQKIKVPFFICLPDRIKREINLASTADMWPTILDYMTDEKIDWSKYFNGISYLEKSSHDYVTVTAPLFPYDRDKMALITPERKFWLKKSTETMEKFVIDRYFDIEDKVIIDADIKKRYEAAHRLYLNDVYRFLKKEE